MADDESEFRPPLGVTTDDDTPKKGLVRVTAVIPQLEVKKSLLGKEAKVKNGTINTSFKEQSLKIDLEWKSKSSHRYRIIYHKLPDKIIPEDSTCELKSGKVIITLKKADDRSWTRDLATTGLETMDPDES